MRFWVQWDMMRRMKWFRRVKSMLVIPIVHSKSFSSHSQGVGGHLNFSFYQKITLKMNENLHRKTRDSQYPLILVHNKFIMIDVVDCDRRCAKATIIDDNLPEKLLKIQRVFSRMINGTDVKRNVGLGKDPSSRSLVKCQDAGSLHESNWVVCWANDLWEPSTDVSFCSETSIPLSSLQRSLSGFDRVRSLCTTVGISCNESCRTIEYVL